MKVIFLRHGQTDENVARRHQPNKTPLSPEGVEQVRTVAKQFADIGVSHIIASPHNRTLQTASIVGEVLNIIPSIDYAVRELERPANLVGHRHFSLRSLWFYKWWFLGFAQGGETYAELRERIVLARQHLERLPADATVIVVSHTVFINLFLAHLKRSHALSLFGATKVFLDLVRMPNTATVTLMYENGTWERTTDLHLPKSLAR